MIAGHGMPLYEKAFSRNRANLEELVQGRRVCRRPVAASGLSGACAPARRFIKRMKDELNLVGLAETSPHRRRSIRGVAGPDRFGGDWLGADGRAWRVETVRWTTPTVV